ncbi:MAG: GntR family transcriptional regulator [Chloroflexi bacterium]|nr:GntR family transcriptional regulator [Chloroflexota bacterium]
MTENSAVLPHIENKPLRERVLDVLRDAIVSGELKPGQQLVEVEFAARLGISRAPLREALQILSREGLVETVPYRGTVVRQLTKTDIEELYSLRSVLETFAVQRVAARANPEDVTRLRQCFDEMLAAAEAGDLKTVNRIDRRFHDTLIELSGHSLLGVTWSTVSMRVRQVMALRNERNTDIRQIAYNHLPIIEAIEQGDEARAVRLIQEHVASSGDLVAENWDESQNGDES